MSDTSQFREDASIAFGEFNVHLADERLSKDNEDVKIEPQLFSLLELLIANAPNVTSRDEIQQQVWSGRHVSDEAIRAAIKKLRNVLGDDAKSPKYIKTIPRQGYKLVATITPQKRTMDDQSGTSWSIQKVMFAKPFLSTLIILTVLCVFLAYYPWNSTSTSLKKQSSDISFNVSKLTEIAGSEVYASYHHKTQKIAFSHRRNSNAPQQIFIKNIVTGQLQKLSWDNAHYTDVHWSQNGARLAFTRSVQGNAENMYVDLDRNNSVIQLNTFKGTAFKDKFVVGWAGDHGLYLAQEKYAAQNRSIYKVDLHTEQLEKITAPNVIGSGDFLAAESFDGKKLAILREIAENEFTVLVIDLDTGALLANRVLSMFPTRVIWHQDNNSFTVSAFNGSVARFNIEQNTLTRVSALPAYANDIFAHCGKQCYFMRQHNGNYLDIQERPNPLLNQGADIALSSPKTVSLSEILPLPGSQDLPTYSNDAQSIYFATYTDSGLKVEKKVLAGRTQIIACWPRETKLDSLQINADETQLAAIINNRLVVQPILKNSACSDNLNNNAANPKQPNYITNALEHVSNPYWHQDNQSLYLTVYENGSPNIAKLDLDSTQQSIVAKNYLAYQPINNHPEYLGVAIDPNMTAWLFKGTDLDKPIKSKLTRLESANPHRWTVDENGLTFTTRQGRDAYLNMVGLTGEVHSGETNLQRTSIGINKFRLNFDLHPQQQKVLLVESLSAESDLIKVTW